MKTTKKVKENNIFRFCLKCFIWLWANRNWEHSRYKFKAMLKDCSWRLNK